MTRHRTARACRPPRPLDPEGPFLYALRASALPPPLRRGVPGGDPPPGVLAAWIARAFVVQTGSDARRSSANVRLPVAAQVDAVKPFVLDGLPGATPAGHSAWSVVGRAFGACCFAGKLRSPAPPTGEPRVPGPTQDRCPTATPTPFPTRIPTAIGTPAGCVPPRQPDGVLPLVMPPRGASQPQKPRLTGPPQGEWSGRAVWCASRD